MKYLNIKNLLNSELKNLAFAYWLVLTLNFHSYFFVSPQLWKCLEFSRDSEDKYTEHFVFSISSEAENILLEKALLTSVICQLILA